MTEFKLFVEKASVEAAVHAVIAMAVGVATALHFAYDWPLKWLWTASLAVQGVSFVFFVRKIAWKAIKLGLERS